MIIKKEQLNKGFTLVELIVSIAIFAIVAAAIIAFFRVAMAQYRTNTNEVNLQTESQNTWKRLESNILMANQAIWLSKNSVSSDGYDQIDLYKYDETGANKRIKTSIYYSKDPEKHTMYYKDYYWSDEESQWIQEGVDDTTGSETPESGDEATEPEKESGQVFANLVTKFNVKMYDKNGNEVGVDGGQPVKVEVHIEYEANRMTSDKSSSARTYISDNTVALRNPVIASNNVQTIYANVEKK